MTVELEREINATKKWFDIIDPQELVEAIKNIRRISDLGPVRIDILGSRVNAFEQGGLISPELASELKEHLSSLSED